MAQVKQAETFGTILYDLRKKRQLTQDELILRCGNILSKSYLSQLENGRTRKKDGSPVRPDEAISDALADALGASKNEFRRLTGHPSLEDESTRDEIADEFTFMLARYKQLSDRGRIYIKNQVGSAIDFVFAVEQKDEDERARITSDVPSAHQTQNFSSSSLPSISIEDAKKLAKRKKANKE